MSASEDFGSKILVSASGFWIFEGGALLGAFFWLALLGFPISTVDATLALGGASILPLFLISLELSVSSSDELSPSISLEVS
jgi:hypothetical protein